MHVMEEVVEMSSPEILHINVCAEKSLHQQFRVTVITLWEELVPKSQAITFIMSSGVKLPWLPYDFISPQWLV
jgi:hypothetical protein